MNRFHIARSAAALVFAATVLVSIPLVLGFFADRHPALDSFAHFRAHLAVLLAIGGLALLASRFWKQGLLAVALGAAALWTTLSAFPLFGPTEAAAEADKSGRAVYRLLHLNLRFNNRTPERVLSLIGRTKPDVITLNEVSDAWKPRLEQVAAMYPYAIVCDRPGAVGGVAILSRRQFAGQDAAVCLDEGKMAIARVDFGGTPIEIAALHLHWPWPFGQAGQIESLEPVFAGFGETVLLAGDLNAATWSATLRRIEAAGGLAHVVGIGPTWLTRWLPDLFRPYVGLPIDQIFEKGGIAILSARTLEAVGSDHLPVLVEFSLTRVTEPGTATVAVDGLFEAF